jgi:4-amino-4-deoxy-L-arabinose transferase-like glycosyltransferase
MTRRLFLITSGLVLLAVVLSLVQIERTPLPWGDEFLFASTAEAIASGHPGVPAVLGRFPGVRRFDTFYGSVPFWVGAASFRVFGISIWSWRLLWWFFGVLIAVAAGYLTWILSGSRTRASLSMALVALSPAIGSRLSSGRVDSLPVALELLALCLLEGKRPAGKSIFAGFLLGAAALSTPRSGPFLAAIFVALVVSRFLGDRDSVGGYLPALGICLLLVTAWTTYVGLTPWSWLQSIARASSGDRTNSSPMLGGAWGLSGASPQDLIVPIILALLLVVVFVKRNRKVVIGSRVIFISGVTLLNAALTAAVTSRLVNYQIFWVVPLIPVMVAACGGLDGVRSPSIEGLQSKEVLLLLAMLVATAAVRVVKVGEVFASWQGRDPQQMSRFVCSNVPRGSVVYGPPDLYYYAVEECGSRYLYAKQSVAPGFTSPSPPTPFEQGAYLIWQAREPLPPQLSVTEVARFQPGPTVGFYSRASLAGADIMRRALRFTGGYPEAVLYQVK